MPIKRINFSEQMETRDDTLNKDALMVNCFADNKSKKPCVMKRFGTNIQTSLTAGEGQGLFTLGASNYAIISDLIYRFDGATFSYPAPSPNGLPYQSVLAPNSSEIVLKTNGGLYVFDGSTVTPVPAFGSVANITMLAAGTNGIPGTYAMTFTGGSGASAAGTYTIGADGTITSTTMTVNGTGYQTSAPTVTFPLGVPTSSVTFTLANPCIVGWTGHNLQVGTPITFTSSEALPFGITAGTTYYVISAGLTANSFEISLTNGGSAVSTIAPTSTVTIDIATPCVIYWAAHGLAVGNAIVLSTTGALPTGLTAGTAYFIIAAGFGTGEFQISATVGGAAINTGGSQSGTQTATGTQAGVQTASGSLNAVGQANISAYPAVTVPGIVYLDGAYYVMDAQCNIWGSNINDPMTWTQLNYIIANGIAGTGVALNIISNYLVALKSLSTEFFYDAANPPPGSALSVVPNQLIRKGCADAGSIAQIDDTIIMVTTSEQRGMRVEMFNGLSLAPISTPSVDRVINRAEISAQDVYAYGIRIQGHTFYVLTIKQVGATLVYDLGTKLWQDWSTVTQQAPESVTALVSANGIATATVTSHGYNDGDPVIISGAVQTAYNGQFNISYVDANTFTYPVAGTPVTPATGTITATGYTDGIFPYSNYGTIVNLCTTNTAVCSDAVADCAVCDNSTNSLPNQNSGDILQHETNGQIHFANPDAYNDVAGPIDLLIRTGILDGETTDRKHVSRMEVIGDKVSSNAYIRYTDDDYNTFCGYRPVALAQPRSMVRRGGSTRRRAFDIRHTDNVPLRLESLEVDIDVGEE